MTNYINALFIWLALKNLITEISSHCCKAVMFLKQSSLFVIISNTLCDTAHSNTAARAKYENSRFLIHPAEWQSLEPLLKKKSSGLAEPISKPQKRTSAI